MEKIIKGVTLFGYKGFKEDLTCHGYQYEEGKKHIYRGEIQLCVAGFHFCLDPADTMFYYPIASSKYGVVVAKDVSNATSEMDTKRVARKIKLIKVYSEEEWVKLLLLYYKVTYPDNPRAIFIDRRNFEIPDKITVETSGKVIVIKGDSYGKITIIGENNIILIPENILIKKIVVKGRWNNVINLGPNIIIIRVSGEINSILNLGSNVKLRIGGEWNTITNKGKNVRVSIEGKENKYRGIDGDKITLTKRIETYVDNKLEVTMKRKRLVIGKKLLANVFYKMEDLSNGK